MRFTVCLLPSCLALAAAAPLCVQQVIDFTGAAAAPTAIADPNDGTDRIFVAFQVRRGHRYYTTIVQAARAASHAAKCQC